ncbi:MAG: Maf family protein [Parcubacteria group bacterium]|nr:Maf family protein [Parcubacteria group bacterium]
MKIILGSQSENRRQVLREAGYTFEVMISDIDEKAIRHENPYEIPVWLAKAKAAALLPKIKEPAFLITADQVIIWNGELREKATSMAEARHFLMTFSGSKYPAEHVNGITVMNAATGKSRTESEISRAYFSVIPQETIERFLKEGTWNKYAGGYDVRHPLLIPFIRLEGTMDSALGLPLDIVERCMKELT